jgi:hypothetical protein
VLAVLGGAALAATVIEPSTLNDLATDAGLIVRGQVTDVRAVAVPGRGIESVATVAVDRVLKGDPLSFVAVRVPGGTLGRYRHVMVGAPKLRVRQHAVFFLVRAPDHGWRPVGLSAGVVRIVSEPVTGRPVVYPVVFVRRPGTAGPIVRGDGLRRLATVGEFESMVELALRGAAPSGETR